MEGSDLRRSVVILLVFNAKLISASCLCFEFSLINLARSERLFCSTRFYFSRSWFAVSVCAPRSQSLVAHPTGPILFVEFLVHLV
jgi:hypothetical protein